MGPQAGAASVWGSAPPPPRPGCGCEASGTATFLRILVWGTSSCRSCPLEPPASGTIGGLRGESRCLDFQTGRGVQSYTDLTCCPDPLSSAELGRLGGGRTAGYQPPATVTAAPSREPAPPLQI
ncbi:PREDICTED: neuron-specific vesicular protein calcyon isoform X5 [Hipposideros armiger]|uniref:Neuron-specific vesicular protein calcyon isoform X5 n=1 Tax=Hipposideros armiger TaxID=186990 RepID=A0A8B7RF25_HIPAR|nr:PREDICTED: neuron-specific vesicular protein calcyon isoform X5 [Hipposideros armiger]